MLNKILFLSIIIYSIQTSLNVLSDLPKQSLFFSSSEKAKIDLNGFSFKSSYDTDMVIQKYEKENILPSKNTMSVYVNSLYNKNLICLDISQDNFYTLKKADKKEFVEKLFDISIFGDMYNSIHKDLLALDKNIFSH